MADHPMFGAGGINDFKFGSSQVARVYHGSNLIWPNLVLTIDTTQMFGTAPVGTTASDTATVTVHGAVGTVTYSWTITSGTCFTLGGAGTATVTGYKTSTAQGDCVGAVKCTVMDGNETRTITALVTLSNVL